MTKINKNDKTESKFSKNKLFILLFTYLIVFINDGHTLPAPIWVSLIEIIDISNMVDISSFGLILGIISIAGVFVTRFINYKNKLLYISSQLGVVCIMYLSWLVLAIYGVNTLGGTKAFWLSFGVFFILSTPFQIVFLIIFAQLIRKIYLIIFKKSKSI